MITPRHVFSKTTGIHSSLTKFMAGAKLGWSNLLNLLKRQYMSVHWLRCISFHLRFYHRPQFDNS